MGKGEGDRSRIETSRAVKRDTKTPEKKTRVKGLSVEDLRGEEGPFLRRGFPDGRVTKTIRIENRKAIVLEKREPNGLGVCKKTKDRKKP